MSIELLVQLVRLIVKGKVVLEVRVGEKQLEVSLFHLFLEFAHHIHEQALQQPLKVQLRGKSLEELKVSLQIQVHRSHSVEYLHEIEEIDEEFRLREEKSRGRETLDGLGFVKEKLSSVDLELELEGLEAVASVPNSRLAASLDLIAQNDREQGHLLSEVILLDTLFGPSLFQSGQDFLSGHEGLLFVSHLFIERVFINEDEQR